MIEEIDNMLKPSKALSHEIDGLISKYRFLTKDMHEELQHLLETLDKILTDTPYYKLNGMPAKEHDKYLKAFKNMSKAAKQISDYSRHSRINELRKMIEMEQSKFLTSVTRRTKDKKGQASSKNHDAHDAALHIGLFLRDTVGLTEFN